MNKSRIEVIAKLKQTFGDKFFVRRTEEFDGTANGLWISNESPMLFDQSMDYTDPKLTAVLNDCNWFIEPYDGGTLFLFPN